MVMAPAIAVLVEQTLGRIALVQHLAQFADHAARQIEQQDRRVARQRIQQQIAVVGLANVEVTAALLGSWRGIRRPFRSRRPSY